LTTITSDKGTLQLSAAVLPSNATNKTVTWSVVNGTGQASINSSGLLLAISNGTVTAKASANDGSGIYGTLLILISNQFIVVNPVYVGSVIEDANPSVLEITYNLSLSNVVPSASAFTVMVNSVARGINDVAVSGSKVILNLSSPVSYGEVVSFAYSKPAANPVKSSDGGEAASLPAQSVTNRVKMINTPPVAVVNYTSSVLSDLLPRSMQAEAMMLTMIIYLMNGMPL